MAHPPTAQAGRCPMCWAQVRPALKRCPSCRADLTASPPKAVVASAPKSTPNRDPGHVLPIEHGQPPSRRRYGPWVVALVGVIALATAGTLKLMSSRLPPPAEYGAATGNVAARVPVTRSTAVRALMAFVPAGDVEPVGTSLGFATTDHANLAAHSSTTVTAGPSGSQIVTVEAPVDLAFFQKVHAIQTSFGPNLSNLAKGRLYINAADTNAYGIVMDPRTHVATFRFRVSASDSTIWPLNLNAMQVISQTQSLG